VSLTGANGMVRIASLPALLEIIASLLLFSVRLTVARICLPAVTALMQGANGVKRARVRLHVQQVTLALQPQEHVHVLSRSIRTVATTTVAHWPPGVVVATCIARATVTVAQISAPNALVDLKILLGVTTTKWQGRASMDVVKCIPFKQGLHFSVGAILIAARMEIVALIFHLLVQLPPYLFGLHLVERT